MAIGPSEEIPSLCITMENIIAVVRLDKLRGQIVELSGKMVAPDLWDGSSTAWAVTSVPNYRQNELDRITQMSERIDDPEVMVDVAAESPDKGADALAEIEVDLEKLRKDLGGLEIRTPLDGEYGERNAVIIIRSGVGGADATGFIEVFLRMYLCQAERHDYPTKVMDTSYAEEAGLKSATFEVQTSYVYDTLSVEASTYRLVHTSPSDNRGHRRTSFMTIEITSPIEITDHIEIPESELEVDIFRPSGPGDQFVNTTGSAMRMMRIPTSIVVSIQDEKFQVQNRVAALQVLQSRLLMLRHEEEQVEKKELAGDAKASWGDRIYSYVFQPYWMIKDLRTEYESGNPQSIFDGGIDDFINAGARWRESGQKAAQD